MGKTIAEKILARASGKEEVKAGDYVTAKPDLHYNVEKGMAEVHKRMIEAGLPNGLPKLAAPEKLALIIGDHSGCHGTAQVVGDYKLSRDLAKRYGIEKVYDINTGISHVAVPEEGLVKPGMLVCGRDSHSTTTGALNALSTPISTVETAWLYLTGELWFRVPETIKFICNGKLQDGVRPKDIFLYMIGKYTPSLAQYKSLEFKGSLIDSLSMDQRMTLACHGIELGAKCVPFEPDQICLDYVNSTPDHGVSWEPVAADSDAIYEQGYEEDFTNLEPQVALPHGFNVIKPVHEVEGIKVDQVNVGSCADSRYDDLVMFARIVKGKKVKARTIVSPGSWKVYRRAIEEGLLKTLADAGVMILAPSCLVCSGRGGCIADGEVAVGSTTRNFQGRYGSPNAHIYLASPATAAASAVMGEIFDPRKLL